MDDEIKNPEYQRRSSSIIDKKICYICDTGAKKILDSYEFKDCHHYYCIDCGKEISHGATRCYECATLNKRLVPRPTKEQLYEDLLNNSFLAVGKKYGVSDNAVRKWCKSYNIPSKASEYKKLNKGVR